MDRILSEFFVLSKDSLGGAYHYTLTGDGTLREGNRISVPHPMWGEIHGGRLCIAFLGDPDAENIADPGYKAEGYAEYSLTSGGMIGDIFPTQGREVCHFCRDGGEVYFANYSDGSICQKMANGGTWILSHTPTDSLPLGPNPARQERAHVHQCILSPDKKFVLVCDLGLDCVFVYDRNLVEISHAKIPSGHGARHAVFSGDGRTLYVVGEMGASITEFAWDDGTLTYRNTVDIRPAGMDGDGAAAAIVISPDGRHIYATNRNGDTIVHLRIEAGGLRLLSQVPCGGRHPRDFKLIANGRAAICCNQVSNSFALFAVLPDGEFILRETVSLPVPVCVCEM